MKKPFRRLGHPHPDAGQLSKPQFFSAWEVTLSWPPTPHAKKKTALWRDAWLLLWLRYFFNFLPLVITIIKPWLGEYVCFCPTTSSKSKFTTICMVRILQCMSSFLVWILASRDYIISMDSHIWDEDGIDKLKLKRKHIPLFGLFKVMFYFLSC